MQKFRWLMRNNTTRQYLVHSCRIIYCFRARLNCNKEELLKWVLSTQVETYFCLMWCPRSKWRRLLNSSTSCSVQVPKHSAVYMVVSRSSDLWCCIPGEWEIRKDRAGILVLTVTHVICCYPFAQYLITENLEKQSLQRNHLPSDIISFSLQHEERQVES